ncbi:MAG TPA: STAS domain-containing protein [Actinoplanes sp.]
MVRRIRSSLKSHQAGRKAIAMQASVTDLRTDIAVLHLRGELDADTAAHLHAAMASLLARPVPRIVVDLAGLRFCDSTGLSMFIVSKQVITARGGWLSFACASQFLEELMETVGLTRYFTLHSDVDTAILASMASLHPA